MLDFTKTKNYFANKKSASRIFKELPQCSKTNYPVLRCAKDLNEDIKTANKHMK